MDQKNFGKFISELRKEKNMTQEQLAEKVGVTDKSISRWENGNTMPDITIIMDLANILNATLPELLNGRRMTKEELIAQKETINNLIEMETNKQLGYNRKAINALLMGNGLLLLSLVDNELHYLRNIFTESANDFVSGLFIGLAIVSYLYVLVNINNNNKLQKNKIKLLSKFRKNNKD